MVGTLTPVRVLIGLLAIAALPASASNLGFLRDTPMSHFNDTDMNLFQTTLTQTLFEAKDNETRTWSNPKTKSRGEITARNTQTRADGVCREATIVNTAKGQTAKTVYTFCREQGGDWKVRAPKTN